MPIQQNFDKTVICETLGIQAQADNANLKTQNAGIMLN